jgi:hypothetical protein
MVAASPPRESRRLAKCRSHPRLWPPWMRPAEQEARRRS